MSGLYCSAASPTSGDEHASFSILLVATQKKAHHSNVSANTLVCLEYCVYTRFQCSWFRFSRNRHSILIWLGFFSYISQWHSCWLAHIKSKLNGKFCYFPNVLCQWTECDEWMTFGRINIICLLIVIHWQIELLSKLKIEAV